jgi:hypothetical protein
MFVVFYSVKIVYICVFMTCSTSYCLCLNLKIHGIVCMYVRMYVCTYNFSGTNKQQKNVRAYLEMKTEFQSWV